MVLGELALAWLARSAAEFMLEEARRTFPDETGGVLLGYWVKPRYEVVVVRAVGPGPGALHSPYGYTPDHVYHEVEVAAEYMASDRKHAYLGDWHSHPRSAAYLSPKDLRTLRRIAKAPEARAPNPVMLVMSGSEEWGVAGWFLERRGSGRFSWGWRTNGMNLRFYDG